MSAAAELRPENRERKPGTFILAQKTFRGRQFERDAADVLGGLRSCVRLFPTGRIVNRNPSSGHRLQNHEVTHVPVKYSRQPQQVQVLHLEAQRSADHLQVSRRLYESAERRAL